ncbi:Autoinducer 2 sensor kinase/phosphatase LuxQ [Planctomycetes bacterium Poly30]|uniref:Autoinducer 2 sensor kinase/phosphatase LuxQ n=1 Tax=Saltatorellus ferox TaxID=2528018 RepID=A0A518EKD6_9BACT|nr:Autoinducer 2 sensor kinase/phosphatase LuxQ [Planctomycetes bacterium Poly30]
MTHDKDDSPRGPIRVSFQGNAFAAAAPFGFVIDAEGEVTLVGRALERRLQGSLPRPVDEVLEDVSVQKHISVNEALRAGRSLKLRVRGTQIVLKGEAVPLEADGAVAFLGSPIVQSLDQLRDCGLQLRDFAAADSTPDLLLSMQATKTALTDARELSEKLKESVAKAENAVAAKSRFLAVMSHEIRTPMNGLGSMVDLLRESGLAPAQHDLLNTIDDCSITLGVILNDILDFSKLDAGAVEVEKIPVVLPHLIDSTARMFRAAADAAGVRLDVQLAPELPNCVIGDPTRIRQVLSNLLSNAIKFSGDGSVKVHATLGSRPDSTPNPGMLVEIRISDTGIGISEDAQASLFRPFSQADSSTTRKFGGTGLGLSIARGLARAMGGELFLESSSPAGSTFCFVLQTPTSAACDYELTADGQEPLKEPPANAVTDVQDLLEGMSVLVADDNPVNLVVAGRLLKKLGIAFDAVEDGAQAIEAVRKKHYDLVLMDMMMPNVDGVEASRSIRALDVEWADLPIIAFSAGVIQSARDEAIDAGMNSFLAKPVRLETLRDALLPHRTASPPSHG